MPNTTYGGRRQVKEVGALSTVRCVGTRACFSTTDQRSISLQYRSCTIYCSRRAIVTESFQRPCRLAVPAPCRTLYLRGDGVLASCAFSSPRPCDSVGRVQHFDDGWRGEYSCHGEGLRRGGCGGSIITIITRLLGTPYVL